MTVRQLLSSLDSSELAEWMVHYNYEYYQKVIAQKGLTARQQSDLLKDTLFRKHLHGK